MGRARRHDSNSSSKDISKKKNSISSICWIVFLGLLFIAVGISELIKCNSYSAINGVMVDNDLIEDLYYSSYEYVVDGKEYYSRSSEGWNEPKDIGKVFRIYYLKDNPNVITDENLSESDWIIEFAIGFFCLGIAVFLIVRVVKLKGQFNKAETTTQEKTLVICEYCGGTMNANDLKCSIVARAKN